MKLSLFSRYERLNTHAGVRVELLHLPRVESNMDIWTFGANFNTRENIVIKANYQRRMNRFQDDPSPRKQIVETGIGFIF
ncbi:hypothetical protein JHJ32_00210 [Parapedobacter sp. ISTM3]|nr:MULTISPECIES: hypothetical protein [Parapedobacter]MBK1438393.1 hypothetical protein [Parapedobacter sp. ISTM3]